MFRVRALIIVSVLVGWQTLFLPQPAKAEITIVLQNDFIEHYKRKATIDTQYTVDKAHTKPNTAQKDGDLHVAGRADEVKLAIVAEIMNAATDNAAVNLIHSVEGTGQKIPLTGAWRIWCEHGGNSEQIQGQELSPFTTTNPDHVFEIHPITNLNNRSLLPTLKPIIGFTTKDAHDAFTKYEGIRCRIIPGPDTTTILTTMAGYNYVEFMMEINSEPLEVEDGLMVMCKVLDLEGDLLVHNRRMVMVKGSEPEQRTKGKPIGTRLHVLGIPRINLSLVSWRLDAASKGRQEVLTWGLPYEIIVVGFYEYGQADANERVAHNALRAAPRPAYIPKTFSPAEIEKRRAVTSPAPLQIEIGNPNKPLTGKVPGDARRSAPDVKPLKIKSATPGSSTTNSGRTSRDLIEEK